jgi:hypothetical protein
LEQPLQKARQKRLKFIKILIFNSS